MQKFLETFGGGGGGGTGGPGVPGGKGPNGRPGGGGPGKPGGRGPGSALERLQLIANARPGLKGVSAQARKNAKNAIKARQNRQLAKFG